MRLLTYEYLKPEQYTEPAYEPTDDERRAGWQRVPERVRTEYVSRIVVEVNGEVLEARHVIDADMYWALRDKSYLEAMTMHSLRKMVMRGIEKKLFQGVA